MTILLSSNRYMFDVFELDDRHYMTVTTGTKAEVDSFADDENKAIALSIDVVTRTQAYTARQVTPSIDPV